MPADERVPTSPDTDVSSGQRLGGEVIRVAIVDDHAMVAEGLAAALDDDAQLKVVGTAGSAREAVLLVRRTAPDVVLLDYRLPDGSGAEVARELRAVADLRVVIVTAEPTAPVVADAIAAGCAGLLSKTRAVDDVAAAVRAAHAGEAFFSPQDLAAAVGHLGSGGSAGGSELSLREREILQLVADGLPTPAIAEQLFLSAHTVRNHIRNLTAKLGAHSKVEAVGIAARKGLIRFGP